MVFAPTHKSKPNLLQRTISLHPFILLLLTLLPSIIKAESTNRIRQLDSGCPSVTFQESYVFKYQQSNAYIYPTINSVCGTIIYSVNSNSMSGPSGGLVYDSGASGIRIQSWSVFTDNTFYNISITLNLKQSYNGNATVSLISYFMLVIGSVPLQTPQSTSYQLSYNQSQTVDLSSSYDPVNSLTPQLLFNWSCPLSTTMPNSTCQQFGSKVIFDPLTRMKQYLMVFGTQYTFNVTITNANPKSYKSSSILISITIKSPESDNTNLGCSTILLQFTNILIQQAAYQSQYYTYVVFDNNNLTSVVMTTPVMSLASCASMYQNAKVTFVVYLTSSSLYSTIAPIIPAYFFFDTSNLTIDSALIQSKILPGQRIDTKVYAMISNSSSPGGNQILGFQYQFLSIKVNQQSLFANVTATYVEVNKTKTLQIDASSSYDSRYPNQQLSTLNYNFSWSIQSNSAIANIYQAGNVKLFILTSSQRDSMVINSPESSFTVTLSVNDFTRKSSSIVITVFIIPEASDNCLTLGLKSINLYQIITETLLPVSLQATASKNCLNTTILSLWWSSSSVTYQFWTYIGTNNNTILIPRATLSSLPQTKNLFMTVQAQYTVGSLNNYVYPASFTFNLMAQSDDLTSVITYLPVINIYTDSFIIDATSSSDPEAAIMNSTNVAVSCSMTCPTSFSSPNFICSSFTGCYQQISTKLILGSTQFYSQILGRLMLFEVDLTKDVRYVQDYFYVTIVSSTYYPKCKIIIEPSNDQTSINIFDSNNFAFNQDTFIRSYCPQYSAIINSSFTYNWTIYNNTSPDNQAMVIDLPSSVNQNNYIFRIPPYALSAYQTITIKSTVANATYQTPIGMYQVINDQTAMIIGVLSSNYNYFSSYISLFILTTTGYGSSVSYNTYFQYRIQESPNKYRVLVSPMSFSLQTSQAIPLPPFFYENVLYIDIIDGENNYMVKSISIYSVVDQLLNPDSFATKILSVTTANMIIFDEQQMELGFYKLRTYLHAYANGYVNTSYEGVNAAYFKVLCEQAIIYMNQTIITQSNLDDITMNDRKRIIKQHTIETLSYMTYMHKDLNYQDEILELLDVVTSDSDYSLGSTFIDASSSALQVIYQSMQYAPKFSSYLDTLCTRIAGTVYSYLLDNELQQSFSANQTGFQIGFLRISPGLQTLPTMVTGVNFNNINILTQLALSISKGDVLMMMSRNSTFLHIQILDSGMNVINIRNLNQNISVDFTVDQPTLQMFANGLATYYCASREVMSNSWSKQTIQFMNINNDTGTITCSANHLSQYALFIQVKPLLPNNTNTTNNSNGSNTTYLDPLHPDPSKEQNTSGQWVNQTNVTNSTLNTTNSSLANVTIADLNPYIFEQKALLIIILELITLFLFLLSSYIFYINYKYEKRDPKKMRSKQIIISITNSNGMQSMSTAKLRMKLLRQIFIQFNPYLNLFLIPNKFLDRWTRNAFLQIYYMLVSTLPLIISFMNSKWYVPPTELAQQIQEWPVGKYIYLMLCLNALIIFGRMLLMKIVYKLYFEADSKVEDFTSLVNDQRDDSNKLAIGENHSFEKQMKSNDSEHSRMEPQNIIYNEDDNIRNEFMDVIKRKPSNNFVDQIERSPRSEEGPSSQEEFKSKWQDDKKAKTGNLQIFGKKRMEFNGEEQTKSKEEIEENEDDVSVMAHNMLNNWYEGVDTKKNHRAKKKKIILPKISKSNAKKTDNLFQLEGGEGEDGPNNNDEESKPADKETDNQRLPEIVGKKRGRSNNRNNRFTPEQNQQEMFNSNQAEAEEELKQFDIFNFKKPIKDLYDFENCAKEEESSKHNMEFDASKSHTMKKDSHMDMVNMDNIEDIEEIQNVRSIEDQTNRERLSLRTSLIQESQSQNKRQDDTQYKKWYVKKKIGKVITLALWSGLIILHIILIPSLRVLFFKEWIILSLISFLGQILIIDSLIYLTLAFLMTQNFKKERKINYFTQKIKRSPEQFNFKDICLIEMRKIVKILVNLFVGNGKMLDLERRVKVV